MLQTWERSDRREDLLSILKDVSPLDGNYLVDNLGTGEASNTLHEWVVRHVSRASSVTAKAEGFTAGEGTPQNPVRSNNITAIVAREVKISRTQEKVDVATGKDSFQDQKEIQLRQLKQEMEYLLINGTVASGASGTARGLTGIDGCISSVMTARSSGASMTVSELEDIMADVWTGVGNGFVGRTLLVPINIARTIGNFSTNVTNYVNSTDTVYRTVRTFESTTGQVKVVPHKDVRTTAGSVTVYLINDEMYKVAYLDKPQWKELATTGDYKYGMYVTEFTLESLAQRTSAKRTGYLTTAH